MRPANEEREIRIPYLARDTRASTWDIFSLGIRKSPPVNGHFDEIFFDSIRVMLRM
jgi:hypothetical protein